MVRGLVSAATALLAAANLISVLPAPREEPLCGIRYPVLWEDGAETTESYASAYPDVVGMTADGVELSRDGVSGFCAPSAEAAKAFSALSYGSLAELLSLRARLSPLESAAVCRMTERRLYYEGDCFRWTGERVERAEIRVAEEVVLLGGTLPRGFLRETCAGKLSVRSGAELNFSTLIDSVVTELSAEEPYALQNGCVTRKTAGVRLVAGMPLAESVSAEYDYADERALEACRAVKEVALPFAGNAPDETMTGYVGDFGYIFGRDESGAYLVPDSLVRVRIAGGALLPFAFYRCETLEEIDVCGVAAEKISAQAFENLPSLKRLHCPRSDLSLNGFRTTVAPCGCTVYERATQ